jgi:hypothetical protein
MYHNEWRARFIHVSPRRIVAEQMGLPQGTVEHWLHGKSLPDKQNRIKFWRFCKEHGIEVPASIKIGKRVITR